MMHRTKPEFKYFADTMHILSCECELIGIEEAVNLIKTRQSPATPKCAFTFDDGLEECYDFAAPVLDDYHINAAFFINPHFVEGDKEYIKHFTEDVIKSPGKKPMRWDKIRQLHNSGHVIGAHTLDHILTASDNIEELRHQIEDCRKIIEANVGNNCNYFAWPFGKLEHTNEIAVRIACETYDYVFSQSDYRHYYSFEGKVINRRHFEPFWPVSHINYFLSKSVSY